MHEGIGYKDVQGGVRAVPTARQRVTASAQARCCEFRVSNAETDGLGSTGRSLQDTAMQTNKSGQAGYLWYSTAA